MDDKGQMYVYEAVIIILLMITAIFFIVATSPEPTISHSIRLFQLETQGDDALRMADELGYLKSSTINAWRNEEEMQSDDDLINYLNKALIGVLSGTLYNVKINGVTFYESGAPGDSTVSSHRIVVDTDDNTVHDVQLIMWYKTL
jgi:hypothetical protein